MVVLSLLAAGISQREVRVVTKMGLPLLVIYDGCTCGKVFGGWLPARFISMGSSVNRARKTSMLLYVLTITTIMCQSGNCCASSMVGQSLDFPLRTCSLACGGFVAMMFFGVFIGLVLQLTRGNYVPVFLLAGSAYLVAIAVIHLLAPRLAVVNGLGAISRFTYPLTKGVSQCAQTLTAPRF